MRLIDADKIYDAVERRYRVSSGIEHRCERDLLELICLSETVDATPVDAIEVVRCKDCKHYKEFRTKRNKQIMRLCCRMGKNDMEYSVKPDDFCSYGERKDVIQK